MENRKDSYTSADALPIKVLRDEDLRIATSQGHIKPIHAQFIPTNKCNLKCAFCSCSEIERDYEMTMKNADRIIEDLSCLGTKAVTVTGGGEPLLHPNINEILESFALHNINVGLVSNGLTLGKLDKDVYKNITWCRISNGDDRRFTEKYERTLDKAVELNPHIDWAFSHVVSDKPNIPEVLRIIKYANEKDFTHVRLVADLFKPEEVPMSKLEETIKKSGVNTDKVIYQGRKNPRRGGDCYIGYLKPLISADYKVYACCGVQYAFEVPSKTLPKELCLGSAFELEKILQNSKIPLKGQICDKCYYTDYNTVLKAMLSEVKHEKFL